MMIERGQATELRRALQVKAPARIGLETARGRGFIRAQNSLTAFCHSKCHLVLTGKPDGPPCNLRKH